MTIQANSIRVAASGLFALVLTALMIACLSKPVATARNASPVPIAAADDSRMPEVVISAYRSMPEVVVSASRTPLAVIG